MYLIYNETEKALKLNMAIHEGRPAQFQIGMVNADGEFDDYKTITTIEDGVMASAMKEFCEKCTDINNVTSRFFFRHPEKKMVSYNNETCEVITTDKEFLANKTSETKAIMTCPRNCIVMVLHKDSRVRVGRSILSGRMPAKTIRVGDDYKILVVFVRVTNWAIIKEPAFIYVDGVNGKKQIKLGFVKTGPNKEYTTNTLFEQDFEGDEFPDDTQDKVSFKKNKRPEYDSNNGDRQETTRDNAYNNNGYNHKESKSFRNEDFGGDNFNHQKSHRRGNSYGKKNHGNNRDKKFSRYN